MLIYHPAFDFQHGIFRYCLLLEAHPDKSLSIDALRILDTYFLFPYLLRDFQFPKGAGKQGRVLAGVQSKYNTLPSPKSFMHQLHGLSTLIVAALAGKDIVDPSVVPESVVTRTALQLPQSMLEAATDYDRELAAYLSTKLGVLPLYGAHGLKARSHLLEHRYDPA